MVNKKCKHVQWSLKVCMKNEILAPEGSALLPLPVVSILSRSISYFSSYHTQVAYLNVIDDTAR